MSTILKKNKTRLLSDDRAKIKFYVPLGLAFILLLVLNILWGQNWIDSDMSAEMVFSDLLGETGHYIASTDWYYSTEFRILYTQLIFVPLLKIIPSWAAVRVITNIITYVILVLSYFFMMKGYEKKYVALTSAILLLPISEAIAQHVQLGNTYMPHMILMFLAVGLVRRLDAEEVGSLKPLWWILLIVLSIICGASGVRYFLIIYAPLLITAFLRAYVKCGIKEGALKKWRSELRLLYIAVFSSAAAFAGYLYNAIIIRASYNFTTYETLSFATINNGIWYERVASVFGCLLEIFGYIPGGNVLSLRGVVTLAAFVMIFLMFVLVRRTSEDVFGGSGALGRDDVYTTEDTEDMFFIHYFVSSFAIMAFFLTFTDTTLTPRYFSTCIYMALPVLVIWLGRESEQAVRQVFMTVLAGCLMLSTLKISYSLMTTDKNEGRREVVEYILSDPGKFGYRGYSFFEDSNVLMELSDGELTVTALNKDSFDIFRWSTAVSFPGDLQILTMDSMPRDFYVFPEGTDVSGVDGILILEATVGGYDIYLGYINNFSFVTN